MPPATSCGQARGALSKPVLQINRVLDGEPVVVLCSSSTPLSPRPFSLWRKLIKRLAPSASHSRHMALVFRACAGCG